MKKYLFLVIIFFLTNSLFQKQVYADDYDYYRYTIWDSKDGLPQNSINDIVQSKSRHLWLTTLEGLVRFDGTNFKTFNSASKPNEFVYDRLNTLYESANGTIWASSEEGGLYEISNDSITYHQLQKQWGSTYITSLSALPSGNLLLGTVNGAYSFDGDTLKPWFQNQIGNIRIFKIIKRPDNGLWIATGKGLFKIDRSTGKLYVEPSTKNKGILDIQFIDNRSGYFISNNTIIHFKERLFEEIDLPKSIRVPSKILLDAEKHLWIGTGGFDTWHYDGSNFTNMNKKLGFNPNVIWSMFLDDEDNIWLGTNGGGLIKISKGFFKTYSTQDGLSHPIVWSINNDSKNNIWASTYFGVNKITPTEILNYPIKSNSQFIWTTQEAPNGEIYALSNSEGIFQLNEMTNQFEPFPSRPKVGISLQVIYIDSKNQLWVTGNIGIARLKKNGEWKTFKNLDYRTPRTVYETSDGSLLFGMSKGIVKIKDDILIHNPIPNFPSVAVRSIKPLDDTSLLISTEGYGLFVYTGTKLMQVTSQDGLYSNFISSVNIVRDRIWMSTNTGVFSIFKNDLYDFLTGDINQIQHKVYNEVHGMLSAETNGGVFPNTFVDEFQNIWYPTMKGVAILNTSLVEDDNFITPTITIDQVFSNGTEIPFSELNQNINLNSNQNQISIRFTVVHFKTPDRFKYAYKLSDYENWIFLENPEIVINELHSGYQTISFSTWTNDGEIVNDLDVFVYREPTFTESKSFIALLIFISLLLIYVIYRIRAYQHHQNEQQLNDLINQRTEALEQEKEKSEQALIRLAQINEKLQNANKMKNDFLSIAAHDLKNPLNGIMGFSDLLVEEFENNDRLRQMAEFIQNSSDKMLVMIERLLEQGKMNDELMNLKFKAVDLSELAWAAASDFFPTAKRKMQRIEISIEDETTIKADPFWIRECIDNLISNALKYSDPGSIIHLRTRKHLDKIWLEVEDDGPGIAKDDFDKLFIAYKRLNHQTTGGESSTGLGLSIVKRVIEQHNGKVEVESELGNGTLFRLIFDSINKSNLEVTEPENVH